MSKRLVSLTIAMVITGCERPTSVVVEGGPAYLYGSSADCEWSLRSGPGETSNRDLRGVIAILPAKTMLRWKDDVLGKESLCYEVERGCLSGYVLASDRVRHVEERPR